MDISVFGLGYVGTVLVGCLAKLGHRVVGVDVNRTKVDCLNAGKSPIVEAEIDAIIEEQHRDGRIQACRDVSYAVEQTDVSFVCVGTPSSEQGHLSLDSLYSVAREIGAALALKAGFHVIVIRSTVQPGTCAKLVEIMEESSGKARDHGFAVVVNPEFLREGTAVRDFFAPPYTLMASSSPQALDVMKDVYSGVAAPCVVTDVAVAEMIKYVNNAFHALKVVFSNEVGSICKKVGVDSREVMRIFCMDTKLNLSASYMKPGFAYGGSCLPKDLRALMTIAHDWYLRCPVLESVHYSNEAHKDRVLEEILAFGKRRIGFLGVSFKSGTDDVRSSPIIEVIERLLGKGYEIMIYDRNVHVAQLSGANREFILSRIPLISRFMSMSPREVIDRSDLLVIVNADSEYREFLRMWAEEKIVYDLVSVSGEDRFVGAGYTGVLW
jgi:GDP-mannose 6-dehydrogenase